MNCKPILFNTDMVQAIQAGRKSQTRRVIKTDANSIEWGQIVLNGYGGFVDEHGRPVKPQYQIGDVLYVREKFKKNSIPIGWPYHYYANNDTFTDPDNETWTPSIHMPKAAARIFLEVTDVKVERLNDISEEDAEAEGVERMTEYKQMIGGEKIACWADYPSGAAKHTSAYESFQSLWESIYNTWDANPFVWVYSFKQIDKPENFI